MLNYERVYKHLPGGFSRHHVSHQQTFKNNDLRQFSDLVMFVSESKSFLRQNVSNLEKGRFQNEIYEKPVNNFNRFVSF